MRKSVGQRIPEKEIANFLFAQRSNKSPSGAFKRQQMEGPCPDKFAFVEVKNEPIIYKRV